MNLVLFDDQSWENLLPLTFTRPVSALRVGILTIAEKWTKLLGSTPSYLTRPYLQVKYPLKSTTDNVFVNGSLLPDQDLVKMINAMPEESALKAGKTLLAVRTGQAISEQAVLEDWTVKGEIYSGACSLIDYPWKLFMLNGPEIRADYKLITGGRKSRRLSDTVQVLSPEKVFVEEGFKGEYITLNATNGPIYLDRESEVMEGTVIRGPFSLGEGSTVKLSAKIYGPTTIGPSCRVGGEINNTVIFGNSNKGHEGFLGNAVIGEWCNLGADTNNSNLKNNYTEVKAWNYAARSYISTGLQFCGLFMGDHSNCGINTMFNTGTVIGVSANIFGSGFPPTFIPSFSWGGANGFSTYRLNKVFEKVSLVLERRGEELTADDKSILEYIFKYTAPYRE